MDIWDVLLKLLPVGISAYALIKSNTKQDAISATTVIVKLERIEKDIAEIKDLRADIRALETRVAILETQKKEGSDGK